jgi:hypothetical protein
MNSSSFAAIPQGRFARFLTAYGKAAQKTLGSQVLLREEIA